MSSLLIQNHSLKLSSVVSSAVMEEVLGQYSKEFLNQILQDLQKPLGSSLSDDETKYKLSYWLSEKIKQIKNKYD